MNQSQGYIFSHPNQWDRTLTGIKYKSGDIITLEYDPLLKRLTYIKEGETYESIELATKLRSTPNEPIYFFAMAHNQNDSVGVVQ